MLQAALAARVVLLFDAPSNGLDRVAAQGLAVHDDLQAIVFRRVVAAGDHHASARVEVMCSEVQDGCRRQPDVHHIAPGLEQALHEGRMQRHAGQAPIARDDHGLLPEGMGLGPDGEADLHDRVVGQRTADDATDVVAAEDHGVDWLRAYGRLRRHGLHDDRGLGRRHFGGRNELGLRRPRPRRGDLGTRQEVLQSRIVASHDCAHRTLEIGHRAVVRLARRAAPPAQQQDDKANDGDRSARQHDAVDAESGLGAPGAVAPPQHQLPGRAGHRRMGDIDTSVPAIALLGNDHRRRTLHRLPDLDLQRAALERGDRLAHDLRREREMQEADRRSDRRHAAHHGDVFVGAAAQMQFGADRQFLRRRLAEEVDRGVGQRRLGRGVGFDGAGRHEPQEACARHAGRQFGAELPPARGVAVRQRIDDLRIFRITLEDFTTRFERIRDPCGELFRLCRVRKFLLGESGLGAALMGIAERIKSTGEHDGEQAGRYRPFRHAADHFRRMDRHRRGSVRRPGL